MLGMNFINQIIVGGLGAVAIAGVGFAGSIGFIVIVTGSAISGSVAILVARAYGARRAGDMNETVSVALGLVTVITVPFALAFAVWPSQIMSAVGASPAVAADGASYLAFYALAIPATVWGAVLSGLMRSTGYPRVPMYITIATVLLDSLLAYLLVYGIGPLPELGVAGAGIAILIANLLKTVLLVLMAWGPLKLVSWQWPTQWESLRTIVGQLLYLAIPLGIAELFWTIGIFLYNVIFQQIGDEELAAAQIVATLEGIFIVGSLGLMAAAQALIGKSIGEGDAAAAKAWIRRILRAGVVTGIAFGLAYIVSILFLDRLFPDVGIDVIQLAVVGIVINGSIQAVKVQNMITGAGILPSGNDIRGVIMADVTGTFIVGLPLAWWLGLHTPLLFLGVILARVADELAKLAILNWRRRRINWDALAARHSSTLMTEQM